MLFTVLLGFIVAILPAFLRKVVKTRWLVLLAIVPSLIFIYYLFQLPAIASGSVLKQSTDWVPSLGVNLSLRLDGLSLLFTLLISGIGIGIFVYAYEYLKKHRYIDRFFTYLLLFMSAMLGLVLSDNLLLLFIFWELTSLSSFFLIGFNNESEGSRKSALISFTTTGMGGFFLLAAFVLIGDIAGTYNLSELIDQGNIYYEHPYYPLIIAFFLLGAFTKSAQFPFHFWLPGAMKAPTPVSAYLHSATMVKAGIFLIARFTPILGGQTMWTAPLLIVGGFTMLYAVVNSLYRTDLKSILAYSTISALGVLTFLLGVGTKTGFIAAIAFIIAHALYKASLFLVTGIIDLKLGTRDISVLGGLGKTIPIVAFSAVLAALSSAGLPGSFGFISKDLIYEATLGSTIFQPESTGHYLLIGLAVLTNIGLVIAGFLAGIRPFTGTPSTKIKLPSKIYINYKLWVPPFILATISFVLGMLPHLPSHKIVDPAVTSIHNSITSADLALWHGWSVVLALSLVTLAAGSALYFMIKPSHDKEQYFAKWQVASPQNIFAGITDVFKTMSMSITNFMHNGFLRSYTFKIILFAEILFVYLLWQDGPIYIDYSQLSSISIYEVITIIILCGALLLLLLSKSRLTAVVATSVVGYTICLIFVFYSAPDLAMTQFSIDTLTVVLFVFVLFKLPPFLSFKNLKTRVRDSIIAIGFGVIISLITLKVMQQPFSSEIKDFYANYAYTLAKGKNVVNVILVDFRGMDTMFEIVVLSIAGLGVYSLLKLRLKSSEKE